MRDAAAALIRSKSCGRFRARLFNLHDGDVEIRLGSLDDAPSDLMPMQDGRTIRREHWLMPILHADHDPPQ